MTPYHWADLAVSSLRDAPREMILDALHTAIEGCARHETDQRTTPIATMVNRMRWDAANARDRQLGLPGIVGTEAA